MPNGWDKEHEDPKPPFRRGDEGGATRPERKEPETQPKPERKDDTPKKRE